MVFLGTWTSLPLNEFRLWLCLTTTIIVVGEHIQLERVSPWRATEVFHLHVGYQRHEVDVQISLSHELRTK